MDTLTSLIAAISPYGELGLFLSSLVFFVVLILRGDLVTRSQYNAQKDNADMFKTAWKDSEDLRSSQSVLLETTMEKLHGTVQKLIESLPNPKGDDDEPVV